MRIGAKKMCRCGRDFAFQDFGSVLKPRCRFCYAEKHKLCPNCGHTLARQGKCSHCGKQFSLHFKQREKKHLVAV